MCLGFMPQMFLLWERKAIDYDDLIWHWASWAALAKLKIPITHVQGPLPTDLSHCWIMIELKSKRGNTLQPRVGPWSYMIMMTDTDFPRNIQGQTEEPSHFSMLFCEFTLLVVLWRCEHFPQQASENTSFCLFLNHFFSLIMYEIMGSQRAGHDWTIITTFKQGFFHSSV